MPDASGRFRGISVPADAWDRVFGRKSCNLHSFWLDSDGVWRCSECGYESRRLNDLPRFRDAAEPCPDCSLPLVYSACMDIYYCTESCGFSMSGRLFRDGRPQDR